MDVVLADAAERGDVASVRELLDGPQRLELFKEVRRRPQVRGLV
jgi:hypothetical protein